MRSHLQRSANYECELEALSPGPVYIRTHNMRSHLQRSANYECECTPAQGLELPVRGEVFVRLGHKYSLVRHNQNNSRLVRAFLPSDPRTHERLPSQGLAVIDTLLDP